MPGRHLQGTSLFHGHLTQARAHFERGLRAYHGQLGREQQDPRTFARSWLATTLWLLGYPDQATQQTEEALAIAQESPCPFDYFKALGYAHALFTLKRQHNLAKKCLAKRLMLASEHGFNQGLQEETFRQGLERIEDGDTGAGAELVHQGLETYHATGILGNLLTSLAGLATAYESACQPEAGLTIVAKALALVKRTDQRMQEAEFHRLKGELLLQQSPGNQAEAEKSFYQAIVIAQSQSAKSWELRTASSLARLWRQQGKRDEARELLTPIYVWFTEGLNMVDLQVAKSLLEASFARNDDQPPHES